MSNEDEVIAICTECKSEQNPAKVEKNLFYRSGGAIPCQFCSGIVMLVDRGDKENALKQIDRERGL